MQRSMVWRGNGEYMVAGSGAEAQRAWSVLVTMKAIPNYSKFCSTIFFDLLANVMSVKYTLTGFEAEEV